MYLGLCIVDVVNNVKIFRVINRLQNILALLDTVFIVVHLRHPSALSISYRYHLFLLGGLLLDSHAFGRRHTFSVSDVM